MKSTYTSSLHKNPSRKSCEQTIIKILKREFEEYGSNHHFKQASDFMIYFESLHPASSSLTKQVQRAVNSLNLPRDENGYFMINKTAEEYQTECELKRLLQTSEWMDLSICTPILLKTDVWQCSHILHLMDTLPDKDDLYDTSIETDNGLLFYTKNPEKLTSFFSSLIFEDDKSP